MAANLRALRERQPKASVLSKFTEVGRLLTADPNAVGDDGIRWLSALVRDLQIPPLSRYGLAPEHAEGLVEKAAVASSMKGNPLLLTAAELREILLAAL
jgi:alcohol dehydrogenase class IV